ncbi:MAG: peptidylprolyl isomerase [Verrucomicrobia bacterium]|nr:peptidylprolyl isomerase [Verrucomicrobiota bacterium]
MKTWKPALLLGTALIALTLHSHAQQSQSKRTLPRISDEELFPDKVLAKGKGFEVRQSELDDAFISYKASLAARGTQLPEDKRRQLESDLLDQLIFEKILTKRATAEDKTAAAEEAEKAYEQVQSKIPENVFEQRLRASGMDVVKFRERLQAEATRRVVLNRELKEEIKISDADIKEFYGENPTRFEIPDRVRASHILLSTTDSLTSRPVSESVRKEKEAKIKEIRERAVKGEDFAKLAKEFSDDPGSRDRGGEYTFARNEMVKPFENAAFSLEPGEVSDVVESQFGFHVIKLHEKLSPYKRSLDEAKEDIERLLTAREFDKRLPEFFKKLKKDEGVEVLVSPGA